MTAENVTYYAYYVKKPTALPIVLICSAIALPAAVFAAWFFLDRKKKKAEAKVEAEAETKAKAEAKDEAAQAAAVTAIAPAEQRIVKTRYTATALLRVCRRRSC